MSSDFEKTKKLIGLDGEISVKKRDEHNRYSVVKQDYKKILILNAPYVFSCDETNKLRCYEKVSIWIEDGEIKKVLEKDQIEEKLGAGQNVFEIGEKEEIFDLVYDAGKRGGSIITPGFINAHTHSPMYLMRSAMMIDEVETVDETISAMPRWERSMTEEDALISAIGDITEQQKYGVTTSLSHYGSFEPIEDATRITGHHMINALSAISNSHPENTPELVERFLSQKDNLKSKVAVALHYLHKADEKELEKISKLVNENNLLFTCHMAESEKVAEQNAKKFGMEEISTLEKFGLLREKSIVSHAIYLSDSEIEKACKAKLGVVHLPTSNTIHKSGVFPFWKFHDAGGFDKIALGTDSVVSKSRLDILTEAYQTRMTHLYSRAVKFGSLFKMMTVNGARVLHEPKIGKILPGMKADLVFWKLKDRGLVPFDQSNPMTLLGNIITHNGTTARDVMIEGKFIIKNRKHQLIDESRLLDILQERHMRMRRRVKRSL
jgi:5-methylthioadenosine/S-adenosylhomocysteine deaminase